MISPRHGHQGIALRPDRSAPTIMNIAQARIGNLGQDRRRQSAVVQNQPFDIVTGLRQDAIAKARMEMMPLMSG
jgi:hypothetical protein